ncbi:hypothetical protein K0M31_012128 [Melipona bicolor]|uniref:Uncharacterized protein n=1 Tax=Melipona bicolor TaxID=60889 RepID=A0AA40GAW6_9HYME|nr:hypothetical protein K0M31_012128 [Melipona bicolor]
MVRAVGSFGVNGQAARRLKDPSSAECEIVGQVAAASPGKEGKGKKRADRAEESIAESNGRYARIVKWKTSCLITSAISRFFSSADCSPLSLRQTRNAAESETFKKSIGKMTATVMRMMIAVMMVMAVMKKEFVTAR